MSTEEQLQQRNKELERENEILRCIAAKLMPCHYCGVDSIGKCPSGFPGCALADDIMAADGCANRKCRELQSERDQLRAELEKAKKVNDEILGMGNTYSLLHVLEQLCVATDHLLNQHDCDHHGHEGYSHCLKVGWTYIASIQDELVGKYREPDRLTLATDLLRRAHPNMHTCEVSQWFNDVNEFLKGQP